MKSDKFKVIAAMADLHIGIKRISPEVLKDQLDKNFFIPLNKFCQLDAIFILGDILHTIISLNTEYSELFNWFISKVYKLAKKRKCSVIIIKGTISHDNEQLNNIKHYQNNADDVDFRVYDEPDVITLFDKFKVLVLPDVRVKESSEIDKFMEDEYDLILGHGLIDAMRFVNQESESSPTKTYVFDSDKLMNICKGPILFGHIHQFQHIRNKFYYVGPFTLLERGGYNAGFAVVGISAEDASKYKVEHYVNTDSGKYYNIDITKDIISDATTDELIDAIDSIIDEALPNDLITIRITRGDEVESAEKVLVIESRYKTDKRVSIVKKIKSKRDEETEKENENKRKKFSYILDPNEKMAHIMYRYYEEEIKPKITDVNCDEYNITLDDFIDVLK